MNPDATHDDSAPHPNVAAYAPVEAHTKIADFGATVGTVTVDGADVDVHVYVSPIDGAVVVEVDTSSQPQPVATIRVYVEGDAVFNAQPGRG